MPILALAAGALEKTLPYSRSPGSPNVQLVIVISADRFVVDREILARLSEPE
jgi:hypothetical protein